MVATAGGGSEYGHLEGGYYAQGYEGLGGLGDAEENDIGQYGQIGGASDSGHHQEEFVDYYVSLFKNFFS